MSFLENIMTEKYAEIEAIKSKLKPSIETTRTSKKRIKNRIKSETILISEIKRGSPSKGLFAENLDIVEIAKEYERNGADIISVLTDEKFFYGGYDVLKKVRENTSIPLLCKDFIIDDSQISFAKQNGADLILLIGAVLSVKKAKELIKFAHDLDLEVLFEIHNTKEYLEFKDLDFDLLGINNRDLKTFHTDIQVTKDILSSNQINKPVITESGIKDMSDIESLTKIGVKGFLIGESLIKSENRSEFIRSIKEL